MIFPVKALPFRRSQYSAKRLDPPACVGGEGICWTEGINMVDKVTATYASKEKIKIVEKDLLAKGIPQKNIHINEKSSEVEVIVPQMTKSEIMEILKRHVPTQVH